MGREVWVAEEGTLSLYSMNANGTINTPAVRVEDLVQSISGKPKRRTSNFLQPGATAEDVKSYVIGHEIKIGALYIRGMEQIVPFFDQTIIWMIELDLVNCRYDGKVADSQENEFLQYTFGTVIEGPDFEVQDNDVYKLAMTFHAEKLGPPQGLF